MIGKSSSSGVRHMPVQSSLRTFAASLLVAISARGAATAERSALLPYTSRSGRIAAEAVAAFRAISPDFDARIWRSRTTEVVHKLVQRSRAGRPQPDVLLAHRCDDQAASHERGGVSPTRWFMFQRSRWRSTIPDEPISTPSSSPPASFRSRMRRSRGGAERIFSSRQQRTKSCCRAQFISGRP